MTAAAHIKCLTIVDRHRTPWIFASISLDIPPHAILAPASRWFKLIENGSMAWTYKQGS